MQSVGPYLMFNGNAEEAFTFYQSVFGGELDLTRYGEMGDGSGMPEEMADGVANVALALAGDDQVIMASDAPPGQEVAMAGNDRYLVTLQMDSEEEAQRIYTALSAGGEVIMPLDRTEWAQSFGMVSDKFGVQWMVNYTGDA